MIFNFFLDISVYIVQVIYMWRGGRGKAKRAKGRVGSETSGETDGK